MDSPDVRAVLEHDLPLEIKKIVVTGDLTPLTPEQRVQYYQARCRSLGLNPMTEPFGYLRLNNKLTLYTKKDATDQLRKLYGVSIQVKDKRFENDLFIVQVQAQDREGKTDEDLGFAPVAGLKGDALGNAILKAVTKAKRRVTLSICGLGMVDESEIDSIRGAQVEDGHNPSVNPLPPGEGEASQDPADLRPTTEQINTLFETAKQTDVELKYFGRYMRTLLGYADDVRLTKKLLKEQLSLEHYQLALEHFHERLRDEIERDVPLECGEVVYANHEAIQALYAHAFQVSPEAVQSAEALVASYPEGQCPVSAVEAFIAENPVEAS